MLFLLAYYVLISLICLWAGLLCYDVAGKDHSAGISPFITMITGMMALTVIGEWLMLFLPLKPWALPLTFLLLHLFTPRSLKTVPAKFSASLRRLFLSEGPAWYWLALGGMTILVLMFNAGPSRMDDTESYHIQAVKWIQEFGSVPGIANLHLRFGFNSAWFAAIGLFTWSPPGLNTYLSLNGVLSAWFCFFLLDRFAGANSMQSSPWQRNRAIGWLLVWLYSLVNWYILRRSAASTTYDFLGTVCVLILCTEYNAEEQPPLEWLVWPLFLFTVRITFLPLLVMPLAWCFYRLRPFFTARNIFPAVILPLLIISPFIARNIILSGFPLFPLTVCDWWKADWKADARLAASVTDYIRYFNRVNPMFQSIATTRELGTWGWTGAWWKYLLPVDKAGLCAAAAGYLFYFARRPAAGRLVRVVVTVIFLSLLLWFLVAPDPRFIQGILLAGLIFGADAIGTGIKAGGTKLAWIFCLSGIFCAGYSFLGQRKDGTQTSLLLPRPEPVPPVRKIRTGNIELNIPEKILGNWNPRCYGVDLPCLYIPDPRLRPRSSRLADGFRLDTTNAAGTQPFDGEYIYK